MINRHATITASSSLIQTKSLAFFRCRVPSKLKPKTCVALNLEQGAGAIISHIRSCAGRSTGQGVPSAGTPLGHTTTCLDTSLLLFHDNSLFHRPGLSLIFSLSICTWNVTSFFSRIPSTIVHHEDSFALCTRFRDRSRRQQCRLRNSGRPRFTLCVYFIFIASA